MSEESQDIVEVLADLEHTQWMTWAKAVALEVSTGRLVRWQGYFVPYAALDEATKEQDRQWARKVIAALYGAGYNIVRLADLAPKAKEPAADDFADALLAHKGKGKTIGLDFDGVLHAYGRGWQGGEIYDEPLDGAADSVRVLQAMGFSVVVCTAREDTAAVERWLAKHGFPRVLVTNQKPPAWLYPDDRGWRFTDWPSTMQAIVRLLAQEA